MEFETIDQADLGAPLQDVVQEAVDATAALHTNAPDLDVQEHLRQELRSRGLRASSESTLEQVAAKISDGQAVELGRHDGSFGRSD